MTDFEKVCSYENLYKAYNKAKSGKRYRDNIARFDICALDGINRIEHLLRTKQYEISEYSEFYVYEPKKRLIQSASFKDKIVQHSLCDNVLMPRFSKEFIRNNFAGQEDKGNIFALDTLKSNMLDFYNSFGMNGYILKMDITKFYYSIDHNILKSLIRNYFDEKDLLWLCDKIIDSSSNPGLPLGNQSSQVFGLIYLNEIDHIITKTMGIEYYGRYTDDSYSIHNSKEYLRECLECERLALQKLKLTLNDKTEIVPFKQGIKFLGFHTYINNGTAVCRLNNTNKRNKMKKYRRMAKLVSSGELSFDNFAISYESWRTHVLYGDCEELVYKFDKEINDILGGNFTWKRK